MVAVSALHTKPRIFEPLQMQKMLVRNLRANYYFLTHLVLANQCPGISKIMHVWLNYHFCGLVLILFLHKLNMPTESFLVMVSQGRQK